MPETVNVLHLSDLHFGMEPNQKVPSTVVDQRNLTLAELIKKLNQVGHKWRPHVVAITGDIAWKARKSDYQKAQKWLTEKLLPVLNLSPDKLIICPGNHDIDRTQTLGMFPPPTSTEADEWLKLENIGNFSRPFKTFVTFCNDMGISLPLIGGQSNCLTGVVDIKGLRFVVLNSAWFCRGDKDRNKLWMGKPLLEKMAANKQLIDIDHYDHSGSPITVALFHHPQEWLNEVDYNTFGNRLSTAEYLSPRSHIILNGHVHARPAEPDRLFNRAWRVKGGASYAEYAYQNHFSILRIDIKKRIFDRLTYEFDPGKNKWIKETDENHVPVYDLKAPLQGKKTIHLVIPVKYKEWVKAQCKDIDILKLGEKSPVVNMGLPQIYIPLMANPPGAPRKKPREEEFDRVDPVDIEDLIINDRTLVIKGLAGSGKTTLAKHCAYMLIESSEWKGLDGYLPVLVFLNKLKGFEPTDLPGNSDTAEKLLTCWTKNTDSFLDIDTIKGFCEAGKIIFFLDGLDEIDESLRGLVVEAFHGLKIKYEQCRIILAGRPHGVDDTVIRWFGEQRVEILPLIMDQVEAFIHKWFQFVFESEQSGIKKTARGMLGEVKAHPSIDDLIDSPLMLTAICLLYNDNKELPGQRAELYDRFINNLLYKRFSGEAQKIRNFLMRLSSEMHTKRSRYIDQLTAIRLLENEYKRNKNETDKEFKDRLIEKFHDVEPNCGLLKFENKGYGFIHLTFQEFLRANDLVAGETDSYFDTLEKYLDDEWYREVVQLYIGFLSIQNPGMANAIVKRVLAQEGKQPFSRWRLAVRSLTDIHKDQQDDDTVESAVSRLLEIIRSDTEPPIKAEAGELLGRIGDERDLEEFVVIPNGTYKTSMGEITISDLGMAKYPVTNQWYRQFVVEGGYKKENWTKYWTKNGIAWLNRTQTEHPRFWFDYKWNCPNSPVVGISWWEADAFCRWLTKARRDGHTYRLPSEKEWEAAAAGFEKRKYPFGKWEDGACNTRESGIDKTSPVGIFQKDKTPEGIFDMAGNVWEWTTTNYDLEKDVDDFTFGLEIQMLRESGKYVDAVNMADKKKICPSLRGGSWDFDRLYARCAGRTGAIRTTGATMLDYVASGLKLHFALLPFYSIPPKAGRNFFGVIHHPSFLLH